MTFELKIPTLEFAKWTAAEALVGLCAGAAVGASPLLTGVYVTNRVISEIAEPLFAPINTFVDASFPTTSELLLKATTGSSGSYAFLMKDQNRRWSYNIKPMIRYSVTLILVTGVACALSLFPVQITAIRVAAAAAILIGGTVSAQSLTFFEPAAMHPTTESHENEVAGQGPSTDTDKPVTDNLATSIHNDGRNSRISQRFALTTAVWYAGAALLGTNPLNAVAIFAFSRYISWTSYQSPEELLHETTGGYVGSKTDNLIGQHTAGRLVAFLGDRISKETEEKLRYISLSINLLMSSLPFRFAKL